MIVSFARPVSGQGVSINTSGTPANLSSMLDVSSTTTGVLIPRMTSAQKNSIASPATGLLMYQTDAPSGFYLYNGSHWLALLADSSIAGGDLTGKLPNLTIAAISTAGNHAVAAINAGSSVINPAKLGSGIPSAAKFLRGDGTWNTANAPYAISMGSGSSRIGLTTSASGVSDSVALIGFQAAVNKMVNINGGSYIDPSGTFPMVAVPVPINGTVTSFSFFFRITTPTIQFFSGTHTFHAQLYYIAPPPSNLIGSEQFYPVTGATVSINLTTATGGIGIMGETLTANISGLSFPLTAGSRLVVLVNYDVNIPPSPLQTLSGNVTASVGMQ
ncbi:MAG: hypothetical protein WBB36_14090 [Chitinophagales bacterium]